MAWNRVEFSDGDVSALSASAFVNEFASAFRSAGMPVEAQVYHGVSTGGDHVYYLSPAASAIAKDMLSRLRGTALPEPPTLTNLTLVKF